MVATVASTQVFLSPGVVRPAHLLLLPGQSGAGPPSAHFSRYGDPPGPSLHLWDRTQDREQQRHFRRKFTSEKRLLTSTHISKYFFLPFLPGKEENQIPQAIVMVITSIDKGNQILQRLSFTEHNVKVV